MDCYGNQKIKIRVVKTTVKGDSNHLQTAYCNTCKLP